MKKTKSNKKNKPIKGRFIPIFGTLIVFIVITVILLLCASIFESTKANAIASCKEVTFEKNNVISKEIDLRITEMRSALGYADGLFTTRPDWFDAFEGVNGYKNFLTCKKLYYKGDKTVTYDYQGHKLSESQIDKQIQAVIDSKSTMASSPYFDSNEDAWVIAVSCYDGEKENINQTIGVYVLSDIYADYDFNDVYSASTYVLDTAGNMVLSTQTVNELSATGGSELLKSMQSDGVAKEYKKLVEEAAKAQGEISAVQGDKNTYIILGRKVNPAADWHAVTVLSTETVNKRANGIIEQTLFACMFIVACLLIIVIYFMIYDSRNKKRMVFAQSYDFIADCPNQTKFEADAEELIRTGKNSNHAIVYLDVSNYKYVIQLFGFNVENQMIAAFSAAIKKNIKHNETYGRLNNGRMVMLVNYKIRDELVARINEIAKQMLNFEPIEKSRYRVRVTGGIYCIDHEQANQFAVSEMIDKAAFAQQSIKDDHQENYVYYDQRSKDDLIKIAEIESLMEIALKGKEFKLYLQPKYNIKHNRIDGAEALVRWERPDSGLIMPDMFIPQFEKNGFIAQLDRYMFEETCKLMNKMTYEGKRALQISVNVSRASAEHEDFLDYYIKLKNKYQIADGFIELEFTESMALESYDFLSENIDVLKQNGFRTSIDDFGEGYSSFKALKALPFDVMKLDKFFLRPGKDRVRDERLLSGVIELAQSLEMKTIMEGVETEEELDYLRHMNCDAIQGYIYARPMPKEQFEEFVEKAYKKKVKRGPLGELLEDEDDKVL